MNIVVAKFGGSSLADAAAFSQVRRWLLENPARRVVVVSAPGARFAGDPKVTDLLSAGASEAVQARFEAIAQPLGLDLPAVDWADGDREERLSRGEWMCARLLARYMGWRFVDARSVIRLDARRQCLLNETRALLRGALLGSGPAVLPGFYGAGPDERVLTFPRGGSDITGALAAAALEAAVYENFTDVDGVYTEDPARNPRAAHIDWMDYGALRVLARSGAQVLHEAAIAPVEEAGIPIHILNTFDPSGRGTWIGRQPPGRARPHALALSAQPAGIVRILAKNCTNSENGDMI